MQIDFALERQNVSLLVFGAMSRLESVEDVIVRGNRQSLPAERRDNIIGRGKVVEKKVRLTRPVFRVEREPVATATVRAPIALPHAISCSVSPMMSTNVEQIPMPYVRAHARQATAPSSIAIVVIIGKCSKREVLP